MNKPKILVWDLETAGVGSFSADRSFIVCFGYKWLGQSKTYCPTILDHPGKHIHDDSELLKVALKVMEEADLTIAHYGDKFDRPFLQTRLLKAKLGPLPRTRQVDTCLIARRELKLSSNRLANLASFLNLDTQKMHKGSGWPDWWMGALRGDKKSIKSMAAYCKIDVACLEGIFLATRHLFSDKVLIRHDLGKEVASCVACGLSNFQKRGFHTAERGRYQRLQCKDCGKWTRFRKPIARAPKEDDNVL